ESDGNAVRGWVETAAGFPAGGIASKAALVTTPDVIVKADVTALASRLAVMDPAARAAWGTIGTTVMSKPVASPHPNACRARRRPIDIPIIPLEAPTSDRETAGLPTARVVHRVWPDVDSHAG